MLMRAWLISQALLQTFLINITVETMRYIFLILSSLIISHKDFLKDNKVGNSIKKWVIEKNSSINIQGETNINNFQCDVAEYLKPDTLICSKNETTNKLFFTNSYLTIDLNKFDCHNRLITNNFRNTLKADVYPKLKIIFLTIDQIPVNCKDQMINGMVDIELAHVTKRIEINYQVTDLPGNHIQVNGSYVFSFSDFKLKAPKCMGGLICTKDHVKVNFRLFIREI